MATARPTTNRPTPRPRSSGTSPTRSERLSQDAVDLVQGPDGVWVPADEAQPPLVVEAVPVRRPAAATERGGRDEAPTTPRQVVFTNGPQNGCVLCGRAARKLVRAGPVSAKVCNGCAALGSKLMSLFK